MDLTELHKQYIKVVEKIQAIYNNNHMYKYQFTQKDMQLFELEELLIIKIFNAMKGKATPLVDIEYSL